MTQYTPLEPSCCHSKVIPGSFRGHSGVIPGSFRGHSWVILGSFRGQSGVIPGSFRGHSRVIPESFRNHSGVIPGSNPTDIAKLAMATVVSCTTYTPRQPAYGVVISKNLQSSELRSF